MTKATKGKIIGLAAALGLVSPMAGAVDFSVGHSSRAQSVSAGVRSDGFGFIGANWLSGEVQYINEGEQPFGIRNVNRTVSLNLAATAPSYRGVEFFAKAG